MYSTWNKPWKLSQILSIVSQLRLHIQESTYKHVFALANNIHQIDTGTSQNENKLS